MLLGKRFQVTVISGEIAPLPSVSRERRLRVVEHDYIRGNEELGNILRGVRPEVIVDILGKDLPLTYEFARGMCRHLIVCGSVWMFGEPRVVPTPEESQGPCPFENYARRYREILRVKGKALQDGLPFTAIIPPNIGGPGKLLLKGKGDRNLEVHREHQKGRPVPLPPLSLLLPIVGYTG